MNHFLNKKEEQILKYLFTLIKDCTDYFNEMKKELSLSDAEDNELKRKFLILLSNSMHNPLSDLVENNYQKIVEQNQNLQSALIESNKILDKIQSNLEECCDECICALNEHNMNKDRMTFRDITEEIKRLQDN